MSTEIPICSSLQLLNICYASLFVIRLVYITSGFTQNQGCSLLCKGFLLIKWRKGKLYACTCR